MKPETRKNIATWCEAGAQVLGSIAVIVAWSVCAVGLMYAVHAAFDNVYVSSLSLAAYIGVTAAVLYGVKRRMER